MSRSKLSRNKSPESEAILQYNDLHIPPEYYLRKNSEVRLTHDRELTKDIIKNGLLQPLTVSDEFPVLPRYRIIDGIRRFISIGHLPKTHSLHTVGIPVTIINGEVAINEEIANEFTPDLTPPEIGERLVKLRDRGYTVEHIAKLLSRSKSWVFKYSKIYSDYNKNTNTERMNI